MAPMTGRDLAIATFVTVTLLLVVFGWSFPAARSRRLARFAGPAQFVSFGLIIAIALYGMVDAGGAIPLPFLVLAAAVVVFWAPRIVGAWSRTLRQFAFWQRAGGILLFVAALLLIASTASASLVGAVLLAAPLLVWILWRLPAGRRRIAAAATATLAFDPAAVVAILFDIRRRPEWIDGLEEAGIEDGGQLRRGAVIREVLRPAAGRPRLVGRHEVTEYQPGRRLELRLLDVPDEASDVYSVEPAPGGSRVTSAGTHELSLFTAILVPQRLSTVQRRFSAKRQQYLERLGDLVAEGHR